MSSGYEGVLQHKGIKPELVGKLGKCGHMYHLLCLVAMYNNGNKVGTRLGAKRCYDVTPNSDDQLVMSYSFTRCRQTTAPQFCCTLIETSVLNIWSHNVRLVPAQTMIRLSFIKMYNLAQCSLRHAPSAVLTYIRPHKITRYQWKQAQRIKMK